MLNKVGGLTINARNYPLPTRPVVVACLDGLDPTYLDAASRLGSTPFLDELRAICGDLRAQSAIPSFTNPNNVSIITGEPPRTHGICGNYFYDPAQDVEVMLNDPSYLRCETILAVAAAAGLSVGAVTAKAKLARLLASGLPDPDAVIALETLTLPEAKNLNLNELPQIYSSDISVAVLRVGLTLLNTTRPDLLYLSTTDYVQHLYAPGDAEAIAQVEAFDRVLSKIHDQDVTLIVTADHGMNGKTRQDGTPDAAYLTSEIEAAFPDASVRVILPITDPYVAHHGAFGSFATIYADNKSTGGIVEFLQSLPQVEEALTGDLAAAKFDLPRDRIGDICVVATPSGVFGKTLEDHDLSALHRPLRSHGGLHEQTVPFLVNCPVTAGRLPNPLRNFDAFWVAMNAAVEN